MSLDKTDKKQYSFEECEVLGKEMIDALKSALQDTSHRDRFYKRSPSDPRLMAWKYLEERHVLRVLEVRQFVLNSVRFLESRQLVLPIDLLILQLWSMA